MNVALSLVRRDYWTGKKFRFILTIFYICFIIHSGSAQNLSSCPITKSSIWFLKKYGINLGVNYQDSGLWWVSQHIISLPYPVTSHWWVSILDTICYMKTWNSTSKSFAQLQLITSPDKYFPFCGITYEFLGTNYFIPKRWPMSPLQLSLSPRAQASSYATGSNVNLIVFCAVYYQARIKWTQDWCTTSLQKPKAVHAKSKRQ